MWKYIRLLRLQDQYVSFGAAISGGIFIHTRDLHILWWAVAATVLSFSVFIVNEMVDHNDTDRYSWNPLHIQKDEQLDMRWVMSLFLLCSSVGLALSWWLGLFWWGLAMYVIGLAYSIEPFRLKRRFGLDILSQLVGAWVLPFVAITWESANHDLVLAFLITTSLAIWSVVYPYQLADFAADKKFGLQNTHVILGFDTSVRFGFWCGFVGFVMYILFAMYRWAAWTLPAILVLPIALVYYIRWMHIASGARNVEFMRRYIHIFKPVTQVSLFYLLVVWRFF